MITSATSQPVALTIAAYATVTPISNPASGVTLPASITAPWAQFQTAGQAAVQSVGGTLGNIPAAMILQLQADLNVVLVALNAYSLTVSDPANQSAIAAATDYVQGVYNALPPVTIAPATINLAIPNLFTLANTAYGDATQWQAIANASNQLDPQPAPGDYVISIPALTQ